MYQYSAAVDRVVDGDTLDLIVDLGFKVKLQERFRLASIDAPESYGTRASEAGRASCLFLAGILPEGSPVRIRTQKTGKFNRWVAEVWVVNPDGETSIKSVNQTMIDEGHAVPYGISKRDG